MQPPIPEEAYREFLKTFQVFRDPAGLTATSMMSSPLVRTQIQTQPTLLPHQALQATFTAVLAMVAVENHDYADLLRVRFWEGKQIEEMLTAERPLPMSKRTFSNYQRSAIQTFAFLFLQAESNLQSQTTTAHTVSTQTSAVTAPLAVSEMAEQQANFPIADNDAHIATASAPWLPTSAPAVVNASAEYATAIALPLAPKRHPIWRFAGLVLVALFLLGGLFARDRLAGWWLVVTASTAEPLFVDDFENGDLKWNGDSADWAIQVDESGNHFYCVKTAGPAYTYAQAGNTTWQDYTLKLDLKLIQTAAGGSGNILWHVADGFYPFYLMDFFAEEDGNGFALEREAAGVITTLDQSLNRLPTGVWLPVRIEIQGDQMQLFIGADTLPALQATDPNPIRQGGIGLGAGFSNWRAGSRWEICFDNIQVTR